MIIHKISYSFQNKLSHLKRVTCYFTVVQIQSAENVATGSASISIQGDNNLCEQNLQQPSESSQPPGENFFLLRV